jgi:hypothetical protein
MNSKNTAKMALARKLRVGFVTLACAISLSALTGCFGSPRANDTVAGGALGAGAGALIGGAEGSPGTGALIGGLGGAGIGYLVGTETQNYYGYHGYGYRPYGYYRGGF